MKLSHFCLCVPWAAEGLAEGCWLDPAIVHVAMTICCGGGGQ